MSVAAHHHLHMQQHQQHRCPYSCMSPQLVDTNKGVLNAWAPNHTRKSAGNIWHLPNSPRLVLPGLHAMGLGCLQSHVDCLLSACDRRLRGGCWRACSSTAAASCRQSLHSGQVLLRLLLQLVMPLHVLTPLHKPLCALYPTLLQPRCCLQLLHSPAIRDSTSLECQHPGLWQPTAQAWMLTLLIYCSTVCVQ